MDRFVVMELDSDCFELEQTLIDAFNLEIPNDKYRFIGFNRRSFLLDKCIPYADDYVVLVVVMLKRLWDTGMMLREDIPLYSQTLRKMISHLKNNENNEDFLNHQIINFAALGD